MNWMQQVDIWNTVQEVDQMLRELGTEQFNLLMCMAADPLGYQTDDDNDSFYS